MPMLTDHDVFVGVDGCARGWLAAVWSPGDCTLEWARYPNLASLLIAHPASTIGIDIPLGLWAQGDRPCDKAARKLLGKPRSSSVFAPPIPSILECATYSNANLASRAAIGKGISKQSFELFPKLREGNRFVTPDIQHRVFELHPEVSFLGLAGEAMLFPKRTAAGYEERREWLNGALHLNPPIPARQEMASIVRGVGAMPDDALDAAVAAWTAHRVATGVAIRLRGETAYRGANGLIMEIVY
jgi:predicted RNase H-like nuclease